MMIRPAELAGIKKGEIDLAFRRWASPRVVLGTQMRTAVGLIEVTSLEEVVAPAALTVADAARAGAESLAALQARLAVRSELPIWRVGVRYAGPDPREVLRATVPDDAGLAQIEQRLARLDRAAPSGPWTRQTLDLIDAQPERRAPDLAALVGRETADFKKDVRKLKELGLTESLDIGYRLSPRGEAVVDAALDRPRVRAPRPTGTPLPQLGAPATRALRALEVRSLEAVTSYSEHDLLAIHGVGPIAIARLKDALAEAGLGLRSP